MIRIIVRKSDAGDALHVGGPVNITHTTFDVQLPELEQHLRSGNSYAQVEVVGVELIPAEEVTP